MASAEIKISLVVTTYNWPAALELVLLSIERLAEFPAEVIIADDGSKKETAELIKRYQTNFPVPLSHCWQEDNGFQLAKIRNKAMAMAKEDYIVMIDGDMVLHPKFIHDHRQIAATDYFIQGRRVILSPEISQKVLNEKLTQFNPLSKGIGNKVNAIHCPLLSPMVSSLFSKHDYRSVRGCNMAFWRSDVIKVNGFNEAFVGWGREDSEFVARLLNNNIQRRDLRLAGIAYHLYHAENSKQNLAQNDEILNEAVKNKVKVCELGINQYLK